ncbi:MAG: hypothetical protein J0H43_07720 [Actinobacteria bacterium]|nr:hypothetical protein [Actinomycetota bacterium]
MTFRPRGRSARSDGDPVDVHEVDRPRMLEAIRSLRGVGAPWPYPEMPVGRKDPAPDAFFALDGLLETLLTVLDEFGAFPAVIERELDRYLPFLATTKVLMAAVRAGVGREAAHEAIKENAVAVALEMREKGTDRNDLFARLARDSRLGLSAAALDALLAEPLTFTGAARAQVAAVVAAVEAVLASEPGAADLRPEPIL